jgi:signal peptidase II
MNDSSNMLENSGTPSSPPVVLPKIAIIKYFIPFLIVAIFSAAIDLATKSYVFHLLGDPVSSPDRKLSIIKNVLEFENKMNNGIIWGFFQSVNVLFLILVSILAVPLIILIFFFTAVPREITLPNSLKIKWLSTISLGLILGGAFGNLFDRFYYGGVRDFIHYYYLIDWPIFNMADISISIGVILMIIVLFRKDASVIEQDKTTEIKTTQDQITVP